jgi:hypothetical protein
MELPGCPDALAAALAAPASATPSTGTAPLLALLQCASFGSAGTGYRQYQFNLDPTDDHTGLRSWTLSGGVQIAEIALYDPVGTYLPGAIVTNPGGNSPSGEQAQSAYNQVNIESCSDGVCEEFAGAEPKWLDFNKQDVVFTFESVVVVSQYNWMTANDAPDRDPIKWTLEARAQEGAAWVVLDNTFATEAFVAPQTRHQWVGPFGITSTGEHDVECGVPCFIACFIACFLASFTSFPSFSSFLPFLPSCGRKACGLAY